MKRRVLVAEDDADIGSLILMILADLDCEARLVADGQVALDAALGEPFDLVILDVMLPNMDGMKICGRLRAAERTMPILMLTSKSAEIDRVLGLEMGADDYVTKPFSLRELAARVKGILRRADQMAAAANRPASSGRRLEVGDLYIDIAAREVRLEGRVLELTAKEFDLLVLFASNPNRVFTRTQLLDQVWGYTHDGYEHLVNTHINRLRNKIESKAAEPKLIQTVWGVGYKFVG